MVSFSQALSTSYIIAKTSRFVTNHPLYKNKITRNLLIGLGAGYLITKALSFTANALLSLKPGKDLPARYGKRTWALITGASEGIGKAFAIELARRGFNIALMSHNKEKLEAAEREVLAACPGTQTRIIVSDFTKAHEEDFAEKIYAEVNDLDLSILINNAGLFIRKPYTHASIEEIRNLIIMNTLGQALVTRALLPRLAARTQRSAIINLSSCSGILPMPHQQVYGASKSFVDFLSRGLSYEYTNIDILSVQPGLTETKLAEGRDKDWTLAKPEQVVNGALRSLGNTDQTGGYWKHSWKAWYMRNLPEPLQDRYAKKSGPK